MRDGQQSSRSSGGPGFDNGTQQQWVPRKDCVSGDQVLGGDGIQENGQYNIACDDSKQQNGLHSIFNGNGATNKEEKSPYQRDAMEPVAIIGFCLRISQDATSPQGFWDMLYQDTSAKTEVPSDRFNIKAFYHPDSSRISSINFKDGHFVKNLAAFDAPFFSITPTEAASMDPQQRGLLEITYRALENAGITLDTASGSKTSVHVGCFTREYDHMSYRDPELQPKYQASGSGFALLANRLSWYYNLTGPSMVIDSACSSSLNALHLGCESLRRGESDMGIVAGCNLFFNPDMSTPLTNLNFLSPDGRCYSFDHRVNGYARGEGIGVVIIKRLSDALRDDDTIRAVIRASGANQDGRTPGITQPSQTAQEDLIQATYKAGGLDFHTTRYFEAHGTGTAIGDPIEAGAIGTIFGPQRSSDDPLFIGAVKSNIGHLEGASGIAGVLKTILVLEKGIIPPNIGFDYPNPKILVDDWNIKFPIKPTLWPSSGLRRASVNSFGYGGANCHIVLDDAFNYLRLRQIDGKHNTTKSPLLEMSPDRVSEISKEDRHQCHRELLPKSASNIVATNGFMDSTPSDGIEATTIESVLPDNLNGKNRNKRPQLLVWSASDESGLRRLATAYSQHDFAAYRLENSACFGALAQTMASGRAQFPC